MKISIDTRQLRRAADHLRSYTAAIARAEYRAVNTTAARYTTRVRRDIAGQIALPQREIRDLMQTTKASVARPEAEIRLRKRPLRLARFGAKQLSAPAKHRSRAKGDPRRGIPAGRKQAGVSVKVSRTGTRKRMPGAFLLPLRAGKTAGGNGWGIFVRNGSRGMKQAVEAGATVGKHIGAGGIRHLYGPSPDQVFRRLREELAPEIRQTLRESFDSQLRYELRGTRK